ncbi:MAG: PCRF domain-containing protein, partial [Dialister micraerophilus]|nr:PCRF domain-containing protein [Dialister micraerophilus]
MTKKKSGIHFDLPRLKETIRSYDIQMSDPSFWDDSEKARAISQKATQAKDAYETYTKLFERAESLQELLDMAIEEDDQGMEGDLKQEIEELSAILNKKEIELLLNEEYDTNNAIITFHAGAGGTEAQDWTEMLIRMYIKWAESEGYGIEELNMLPGDEAGIKSAEYIIKGEFAYGLLKSEKGVHRLVRISPFDAAKRRHTSFSAVDVMPEISDDIEVDLNMNDVRVDYYRASGAGGQHVNKTSSAVRMTHLPTG